MENTVEFNQQLRDMYTNNSVDTEKQVEKLKSKLDLDSLTETLFKILTKNPVKPALMKYYDDTPYSQYVINNPDKNITMENFLKFRLSHPNLVKTVVTLYNENWGNTRKILEEVSSYTGNNKVPYLTELIKTILTDLDGGAPYVDSIPVDRLRELFKDDTILDIISMYKEKYDYLKLIIGETMCSVGRYDKIDKFISVDYDYIKNADVGYDLGGGYMTPDISRLFKRPMICVDRNDPKKVKEINTYTSYPEEHVEKLLKQPFLNIDLTKESLPMEYSKYFLSSFGFINSTIGPKDDLINECEAVSNLFICYMATRRVAELIEAGKEVYFIFWGRPTSRVNENKIVSMHFKDGKLINHDILSDKYGNKYVRIRAFGNALDLVFVKRNLKKD